MRINICILILTTMTQFYKTGSTELYADDGGSVIFDLPSVAKCGNYQFLNPQLSPLLIIKNQSAAAIQGTYIERTSVYVVEHNELQLTLNNVKQVDRGKYNVFTNSGDVTTCSKIHFFLNVKAKVIEYLSPWSSWSQCSSPCSSTTQRTRERNCSIPNGCLGFGPRLETESCLSLPGCPVWSEWSAWSICSSLCGPGLRDRNRVCSPPSPTENLPSISCSGTATEEEKCEMKPCNGNATFWSRWGPWGPCNQTCGGGYRQRTRRSKFPDSEIVASFAGWSLDEEQCNAFECEKESHVTDVPESSGPPVIGLIIACACVVFIIILLLVILLLILRLKKKGINVVLLARSFRQSIQGNSSKPISTPEIPRKASEPNAYSGVKLDTDKDKRKSDVLKKDNKRKKSTNDVASTATLSVDSISYKRRPKSGKSKGKRISIDNSTSGLRISAPIHQSSTYKKPDHVILYDTPRSSKSVTEDEIKSDIDADDTYEIPENPVRADVTNGNRTTTPELIVSGETSLTSCDVESDRQNTNDIVASGLLSTSSSFQALSELGIPSPNLSPGYASKFPSWIGLSNLYDTPRSSSSNLSEMIYDVPHNNEPLYVNDDFEANGEQGYETPKISVSSMSSIGDTSWRQMST